jgi:hypothetical protein
MDAATRSFLVAANAIGIEANLEFIKHPKGSRHRFTTGPLFMVMALARKDAIQAHAALVSTDPTNIEMVRKLQNEVQRFYDLVTYVKLILDNGDDAYRRLTTEDEDEMRDALAAEGAEIPNQQEM